MRLAVGCRHRAVEHLGEGFHQGQSHTGAVAVGRLHLEEPLEDALQFVFRNTDACILHHDNKALALLAGPQRYLTAIGCVFHRVAQEIVADALQFVAVAPHKQVGWHLHTEHDVFLSHCRLKHLRPLPKRGGEVEVDQVEPHLSVLHLAEVEDLVDEPEQDVCVALHHAKERALAVGERGVGRELLHGSRDEGERRAELMAHVGEEPQFGTDRLLSHAAPQHESTIEQKEHTEEKRENEDDQNEKHLLIVVAGQKAVYV